MEWIGAIVVSATHNAAVPPFSGYDVLDRGQTLGSTSLRIPSHHDCPARGGGPFAGQDLTKIADSRSLAGSGDFCPASGGRRISSVDGGT